MTVYTVLFSLWGCLVRSLPLVANGLWWTSVLSLVSVKHTQLGWGQMTHSATKNISFLCFLLLGRFAVFLDHYPFVPPLAKSNFLAKSNLAFLILGVTGGLHLTSVVAFRMVSLGFYATEGILRSSIIVVFQAFLCCWELPPLLFIDLCSQLVRMKIDLQLDVYSIELLIV